MKSIAKIALASLPVLLAQDYVVPNYHFDQTDANCENVNFLVANTISDISTLTTYAAVTIPTRIVKLGNALGSVQRTCQIINNRRPSLIQQSAYEAKKSGMIMYMKKAEEEVRHLKKDKCENRFVCEDQILMQLEKKVATQDFTDATELCGNVRDALVSLNNYLTWLTPAIQSEYIQGSLRLRLDYLTQVQQTCGCGEVEEEYHYPGHEEEYYYPGHEEEYYYPGHEEEYYYPGHEEEEYYYPQPVEEEEEWHYGGEDGEFYYGARVPHFDQDDYIVGDNSDSLPPQEEFDNDYDSVINHVYGGETAFA